MRKPRSQKDDGILPGTASRANRSRRERAVRCFEDEGLDASQLAARQKQRRADREEWVAHAAERKDRISQEAKFKEALAPLMAKRLYFSLAEIADEISRRTVDAAGHREPSATAENRWAIVKRLTNDMVAGYFDERGKIIVAIGGELGPRAGGEFRSTWYAGGAETLYAAGPSDAERPYCDPEAKDETYRKFLRACYITREDCAVWLREQDYVWPKSWGFEPIDQAERASASATALAPQVVAAPEAKARPYRATDDQICAAIRAVYDEAKANDIPPPNVKKVRPLVQAVLARNGGRRSQNDIGEIADEDEFKGHRRPPGKTLKSEGRTAPR